MTDRRPLHTYMVQRHRMRIGTPLTFLDGERIVAVVASEPVPGLPMDVDVTVLVELPERPQREAAGDAMSQDDVKEYGQ